MELLESDYDETQVNLFAKKAGQECREAVQEKPPPPCERPNRKPPTLHTFCNHNINIQYKYQENNDKGSADKPCALCIKIDNAKGKSEAAQCPCKKTGLTREEKLAEGIKCISSPLPRWFNEPLRCDPMSVCCRMLGGIKKCPRNESSCTCPETEIESKIDKFAVNYPKGKLAARTELHANSKCKPNFRCQGVIAGDDGHKFKPNFRDLPLTEKFYSKYEHLENIHTPQVKYYEAELEKYENYQPRNVFCIPRYTNQNYGWLDSEKLQHLEFCDAKTVCLPKVLQSIKSQDKKRFDPIQLQYCHCQKALQQMDHWKIV